MKKITKKQFYKRLLFIIYYFIHLYYTINLLNNGYFNKLDVIYFILVILVNTIIYINILEK